MLLPPDDEMESLPVPPNIVIDDPPDAVIVELPPPLDMEMLLPPLAVSESLPVPPTIVIDEPFEFCGAQVVPVRLEIEFPGNKTEKIGRKELGILAYIHENRGAVITRKALIHSVWGIHADVKSRSLDQYIVKVRELFKRNGLNLDAFRTVHGVGYILGSEEASK